MGSVFHSKDQSATKFNSREETMHHIGNTYNCLQYKSELLLAFLKKAHKFSILEYNLII